jgi:hypothetical protein
MSASAGNERSTSPLHALRNAKAAGENLSNLWAANLARFIAIISTKMQVLFVSEKSIITRKDFKTMHKA